MEEAGKVIVALILVNYQNRAAAPGAVGLVSDLIDAIDGKSEE